MFQLSRQDCRKVTEKSGRFHVDAQYRPLLEVTTSGLTHSWGSTSCARPKESFICTSPYFQRAFRMAAHLAHQSGAWTELVHIDCKEAQEGQPCGLQYSILLNFAEFEFDWNERHVTLRILGKDPNSSPFSSTTWNFTYLTALHHDDNQSVLTSADYLEKYQSPVLEGFVQSGDWICINYRGPTTLAMKIYGVTGPCLILFSAILFPFVLPLVIIFAFMKMKGKNGKKINRNITLVT